MENRYFFTAKRFSNDGPKILIGETDDKIVTKYIKFDLFHV